MPLYGKNIQEIVSQSLEDISQNTVISRLGIGGKTRALLDSVGKRLEEAYDIFDINLARAFVSTAPGQYLDLIGDLLACPRLPSVSASVSAEIQCIKFYVSSGNFGSINGGSDIIIPRGTIISSETDNGGTTYRITSEVTCSSTTSSVWADAEATVPGEISNIGTGSLKYHSFTGYTNYLNGTLLVTNIYPIGNGKSFEGDANYRYRISQRVLEAEAANETAIRLAALSAPGVADVVMVKYYRGIGSGAVIIKSITPTVSQALIDDVTARVEKVQGFGSLIYTIGPKETGLSFKLNIYYDQQLTEEEVSSIEIAMEDTITTSVNNLDIGETFYSNKLIASLFSASTHIVAIGETGKTFDECYLYKTTRLGDNKIRQRLLGDYTPSSDERIIIEPSVSTPIAFNRFYNRR